MALGLSSPRYSIDHAKRRIKEFQSDLGRFTKPNPYVKVTEIDPNGREKHVKIMLARPIPETLPGIAFDCANSLRAALDQVGYACAIADLPYCRVKVLVALYS